MPKRFGDQPSEAVTKAVEHVLVLGSPELKAKPAAARVVRTALSQEICQRHCYIRTVLERRFGAPPKGAPSACCALPAAPLDACGRSARAGPPAA